MTEKATSNRVQDCEELDDIVRECEFTLYTKADTSWWLTNILLTITRNNDNIYFKKWFLVAHFLRDNTLFTFEAIKNETGVIEALRTSGETPINPDTKLVVGRVHTSPLELLTLAQQHPYNETNAPILASLKKCQDWFNQFARMVSPNLHLP